MKEYTIYFEVFGKKMKINVNALSEEMAKDIVKDKIVFYKVEEVVKDTSMDDAIKWFNDLFNGKL